MYIHIAYIHTCMHTYMQFNNVDMDAWAVLTVYDHDIVGSHDFLGKVAVKINSLPMNQVNTIHTRMFICVYVCMHINSTLFL